MGFVEQMAKVRTLLGDISDQDLSVIGDGLIGVSEQVGLELSKVTESAYQALSAGIPQEDLTEFVGQMGRLAKAGFTDIETAVDGVTSAMNAYANTAPKLRVSSQQVSDILLMTQNLGKTDVDQLARSLSAVTPIAATLGIEFQQLTATVAVMTAMGEGTSEATTKLRQLFVEASKTGTSLAQAIDLTHGKTLATLAKEGQNFSEVLQEVRESYGDQGFQDLFGSVEALGAALAVTGDNFSNFQSTLDQVRDSSGTTDAAWKTMSSTINQIRDEALAAFNADLVRLGTILLPGITTALGGIVWADIIPDSAFDNLQKFIDKIGEISTAVSGFVAAVAGIIMEELIAPMLAGIDWSVIVNPLLDALGQVQAAWQRVRDALSVVDSNRALEGIRKAAMLARASMVLIFRVWGMLLSGLAQSSVGTAALDAIQTAANRVTSSLRGVKAQWTAVLESFTTSELRRNIMTEYIRIGMRVVLVLRSVKARFEELKELFNSGGVPTATADTIDDSMINVRDSIDEAKKKWDSLTQAFAATGIPTAAATTLEDGAKDVTSALEDVQGRWKTIQDEFSASEISDSAFVTLGSAATLAQTAWDDLGSKMGEVQLGSKLGDIAERAVEARTGLTWSGVSSAFSGDSQLVSSGLATVKKALDDVDQAIQDLNIGTFTHAISVLATTGIGALNIALTLMIARWQTIGAALSGFAAGLAASGVFGAWIDNAVAKWNLLITTLEKINAFANAFREAWLESDIGQASIKLWDGILDGVQKVAYALSKLTFGTQARALDKETALLEEAKDGLENWDAEVGAQNLVSQLDQWYQETVAVVEMVQAELQKVIDAWNNIKQAISDFATSLEEHVNTIIVGMTLFSEGVRPLLEIVSKAVQAIVDAWNKVVEAWNEEKLTVIIDAVTKAMKAIEAVLNAVRSAINAVKKAWAALKASLKQGLPSIGGFSNPFARTDSERAAGQQLQTSQLGAGGSPPLAFAGGTGGGNVQVDIHNYREQNSDEQSRGLLGWLRDRGQRNRD